MTEDEFIETLKELTGYGVSEDDAYPLSTYVPISEKQLDIMRDYAITYTNEDPRSWVTTNTTTTFDKLVDSLSTDESVRFNERYPTLDYFMQDVLNLSNFIDDDYELLPGKTYRLIDDEQIQFIKHAYQQQRLANKPFNEEDTVAVANRVPKLSQMPLDLLTTITKIDDELIFA